MIRVGPIRSIDANTKRKMIGGSIAATITAASLVMMLGFIGGVFWYPQAPLSGELIGGTLLTIHGSIATSFGTYTAYSEDFQPNAPVYGVSPGLSNIINRNQFLYLSPEEIRLIEMNGFVVRPQNGYDQIHDILRENEDQEIPNFITSDAALHAFHVCYDLALRQAEVYSFWDLLGNLTVTLLEDSIEQYDSAPQGDWKEAARRNMIYFTVAAFLLDNTTTIHFDIVTEVSTALELINDAEVITDEWFMEYREDFTQFVPRGHYTRSETLSRYFLTMMWYGRVQFRLDAQYQGIPTQQAILISLALSGLVEGLETPISGYTLWDAIYEPTVFFVGSSDDLTPPEYLDLIHDVYGASPDWDVLQDDNLLSEFIQEAIALRDPMILGSPRGDLENENVTEGMRLMGQRFIPDSYILGQLVYDKVGTALRPRLMPSGLDIMTVFGSERAYTLQEDEKAYLNYESQMEKLRENVQNMTAEDWTQNLYYLWIYSLLPLLSTPAEGYPFFMRTQAWIDKQLNTALASWTELRHDTILYAKQPYTVEAALPQFDPETHGYVEPVPQLYSRLSALCDLMLDGLGTRDLLSSIVSSKLNTLREFLLDLRAISIKELTGEPLNSTDWDVIKDAHWKLESVSSFPKDELITSDTDEFMSLVADVHTDPNSQGVLEEAVGDPLIIIVAVPVDGQIVLTRGGTFSYYEFVHPMNDRLTDEAWREMLDSGTEPDFPEWTESFLVALPGFLMAAISKDE